VKEDWGRDAGADGAGRASNCETTASNRCSGFPDAFEAGGTESGFGTGRDGLRQQLVFFSQCAQAHFALTDCAEQMTSAVKTVCAPVNRTLNRIVRTIFTAEM